MKSFNTYLGGGYWAHMDGDYRAIIKYAGDRQWYGGACTNVERTAPLYGPFLFKWYAKKIALAQLALVKADDQDCIDWGSFE